MELEISQICKLLPHRYPFLLIDRVLDLNLDSKKITAVKNVTINEPFFTGHFPENHVFPGVLLVEACAQASGILLNSLSKKENKEGQLGLLGRVSNFYFKRVIIPGDILLIESELLASKMSVYKFKAKVTVNSELAGTGELDIIVANREINDSIE